MSVKKEASGRRSVSIEVEVPGTPEEVWQAIATGPGISSWFVPAVIEERDGTPVGETLTFGPVVHARSVVTAWQPPLRYAKEAPGWVPESPPIAMEWLVEARAGGTCVVHIVNSLFASTDEWDYQLEGSASAMPGFLRTLRIYLAHFRGQRSAIMQVMTPVSSEAAAWEALTTALDVKGVGVGQSWASPTGIASLSGVLEYVTERPYDALLRLDKPWPGIAALGAMTYPDGPTMVAMNFYVYGDQAAETVARATPVWQAWLEDQFPMTMEGSKSA